MQSVVLLIFSLLLPTPQARGDAAAGDLFEVDPGRLRLVASTSPPSTRLSSRLAGDGYYLLDIDTLFYIENRGLTRLHVALNGHKFKLVTDPEEVRSSVNAYHIPEYGEITFSISQYMLPDAENYMEVETQGPYGSDANLVISNTLVPGQQVAYRIENLQIYPGHLMLGQSYPNPFQESVTITYSIAENRSSGMDVHVAIYDVSGRLLRTLVDGRRFPGTFEMKWDGTDSQQRAVPSGVYLCRLVAGESQDAVTLVRIASVPMR